MSGIERNREPDGKAIVKAEQHILLVDDEPEFRFSASVALRRAGYRVSLAASGGEALSAVLGTRQGGERYTLLITDIRMPGMSGTELIDAVREAGVPIKFCVITGFSDRELQTNLGLRGCVEYIEKPFEPKDLVERVETILNISPRTANGNVRAVPAGEA